MCNVWLVVVLRYTADGACVIGGGQSKWVVLYDCEQRLLLRKWQISHNRSMDGVLDRLHTANLAVDAGGVSMAAFDLDADDDDDEVGRRRDVLPGAQSGDHTRRTTKLEVRSTCVRFSPAGNAWAVASTAGLLIFALDADASFAPYALDLATTPDAVRKLIAAAMAGGGRAGGGGGAAAAAAAAAAGGGVVDGDDGEEDEGDVDAELDPSSLRPQFLRALLMSLHLGDEALIREVFYKIPPAATALLARQVCLWVLMCVLVCVLVCTFCVCVCGSGPVQACRAQTLLFVLADYESRGAAAPRHVHNFSTAMVPLHYSVSLSSMDFSAASPRRLHYFSYSSAALLLPWLLPLLACAWQLPQSYLMHLLRFLATEVGASPHLQFTTAWCKAVLQVGALATTTTTTRPPRMRLAMRIMHVCVFMVVVGRRAAHAVVVGVAWQCTPYALPTPVPLSLILPDYLRGWLG